MANSLLRLLGLLALAATAASVQAAAEPTGERYIIKLKNTKAAPGLKSRLASLTAAAGLVADGDKPAFEHFKLSDKFSGYTATLTPEAIAQLKKDPSIAYIEPAGRLVLHGVQPNTHNWGLPRLSNADPTNPLHQDAGHGSFTFPDAAGKDTTVFILDSGINYTLPEFGGRASLGWTYWDKKNDVDFGWYHGTHVAGIIGSKTWGVAKNAKLVGVQVMSPNEKQNTVDVAILGIKYVIEEVKAKNIQRAVLNVSMGVNGISDALDEAVAAAVEAGITVVVSAGNGDDKYHKGLDACEFSPAKVPSAITVGATTSQFVADAAKPVPLTGEAKGSYVDAITSFSNFGKCVDVFAPGYAIASTNKGSKAELFDGTSQAAPFVAGIAALLLTEKGAMKPADVAKEIAALALKDRIKMGRNGSPNLLAHIGGLNSGTTPPVDPPGKTPVDPPGKTPVDPPGTEPVDPPGTEPVPPPYKKKPLPPTNAPDYPGYPVPTSKAGEKPTDAPGYPVPTSKAEQKPTNAPGYPAPTTKGGAYPTEVPKDGTPGHKSKCKPKHATKTYN